MVMLINHVIPGLLLHCAGPLALWGFRNIFLPNIGEDQKKVLPSDHGTLALRHIMVNPVLVIAVRS